MKSFLSWLLDPLFVLLTRYMAGSGLMLTAFDKAGLTRIGGDKRSTAPTVWTYRTNDAIGTVDGAGYFDNGDTTNTGMRNGARICRRWSYSAGSSCPTRSPVMTVTSGSGSRLATSATARARHAGVSIRP